jgi:hypothetical protein
MDEIQRDMRPGVITRDGFLGHDRRLLIDILDADDSEVKRLGQTHASIAACMKKFRKAGQAGLGETIRVEPHFEVRVDSVRGKLPCPFHHEGVFQKTNITVANTRNGRTITYTDLNVHMIETHGFYEGSGSPFRLDPADLVAVLEPAAPEA